MASKAATKTGGKVAQMIDAALTLAGTAAQRITAFLALSPRAMPGVEALRQRQAVVRTRLAEAERARRDADRSATQCRELRAERRRVAEYDAEWGPFEIEGEGEGERARYERLRRERRSGDDGKPTIGWDKRALATGDMGIAISLAASYHAHIGRLYTSAKASGPSYGHCVTQVVDGDYYSKSYNHPARWSEAAVHVEYRAEGTVAVIHPVRGRDITLPLRHGVDYLHPALIDGDICARRMSAVRAIRYDIKGRITGYAILMPSVYDPRATYWEHGASYAECLAAHAAKLERHARLEADNQARRLSAVMAAREAKRATRRARLVARVAPTLACTVADARSLGHCDAGIAGFRQRYGLAESVTVADLVATGRYEAWPIVAVAARRAAAERRAERAIA